MSLAGTVISVHKEGKQTEKFRCNLQNIRSLKGFLSGQWNLGEYDDCFPGTNRLADMDGSTEVFGHTIHIEFKVSKHALNRGQLLKAIRQAKYSNITTFFVFGKQDEPTSYLKFSPDCIEGSGFIDCDRTSLKEAFVAWSEYAKANNLVENRTQEWDIVRRYTW